MRYCVCVTISVVKHYFYGWLPSVICLGNNIKSFSYTNTQTHIYTRIVALALDFSLLFFLLNSLTCYYLFMHVCVCSHSLSLSLSLCVCVFIFIARVLLKASKCLTIAYLLLEYACLSVYATESVCE